MKRTVIPALTLLLVSLRPVLWAADESREPLSFGLPAIAS